jgi:hypothetical protein
VRVQPFEVELFWLGIYAIIGYIVLRDVAIYVLPWVATKLAAWVESHFPTPQNIIAGAAEFAADAAEDAASELVSEVASALDGSTEGGGSVTRSVTRRAVSGLIASLVS